MQCPKCGQCGSDVIDSRTAPNAVRRRRQCSTCSYRFTTYERVERPRLMVVKKDQRREPFSRDKLLIGLERACEKRSISKTTIEAIVDKLECAFHDQYELEIPSTAIGECVMEELGKLDPVAYIRFASVYREFPDVQSFATVIEMLNNKA